MDAKRELHKIAVQLRGLYTDLGQAKNRKEWFYRTGKGLLLLVYTYLLAGTPGLFESRPFALALLCALPTRLGYAFAGACLGVMFQGAFSATMLLGYGAIFLWRTRIAHFYDKETIACHTEEPIYLRLAASAVVGFAISAASLVGSFTFYGFLGLCFMVVVCPLLTLLFSGAFMAGRTLSVFVESGHYLLRFCLVLSFCRFDFFGFVPALAVAVLISVLTFSDCGAVNATFSGFFTALPLGVDYGVLCAVISLVGAVVIKLDRRASVGAGLLCGMAYAYAVWGSGALYGVFPDLVCGGLFALPVLGFKKVKESTFSFSETPSGQMQLLDAAEKELYAKQEQNTYSGMQHLSQMFRSLSEVSAPDQAECEVLCRRCMERRCTDCRSKQYCQTENGVVWHNAFLLACADLKRKGHTDRRFLLELGCRYSEEIADEMARDYAALYRQKCEPSADMAYAAGFDVMAELLLEQKQRRSRARRGHAELAQSISQKARSAGLTFSTVGVYGEVQKSVFFCDCKSADCRGGGEGLAMICQSVLGTRVSMPRVMVGTSGAILVLETLRQFSFSTAKAMRPKAGQTVCGDLMHIYEDCDQNPCFLLCDGMGSGAHAAIAAGIGCSLSESLSRAGATPKLITRLLNSALRHRQGEDSCSFDLFCFDRYSGMGTFIKSGAAPTLVLRKGSVYNLSADTAPLGIMAEVQSEQIRMPLLEGDLVVMASDGVACDFDGCAALAAIVCANEELPLKELAEQILWKCQRQGKEEGAEEKQDDMSVFLVKIEAYHSDIA